MQNKLDILINPIRMRIIRYIQLKNPNVLMTDDVIMFGDRYVRIYKVFTYRENPEAHEIEICEAVRAAYWKRKMSKKGGFSEELYLSDMYNDEYFPS